MGDLDVEAMLEAPYKNEMIFNPEEKEALKEAETKEDKKSEDEISVDQTEEKEKEIKVVKEKEDKEERDRKDRDRERDKDKDRDKDRDRDRDRRHHSRSHRSRHSSRSSHRHSHHRHRSRRRSRSYDRHKSSSRSRSYRSERRSRSSSRRRRSRSRSPRNNSEDRAEKPEISEADRDRRTVFVMQLSAKLRTSELREFFETVGKVSDVKIIADRNSRRSKGVGYVEFEDEASVEKALTLTNKQLRGVPIIVQKTESEKNRSEFNGNPNAPTVNPNRTKVNPYSVKEQNDLETSYKRLYVGSINFKITEDDLKILFKNFGELDFVKLHINPETGRSCGYAFIQYKRAEDAKKALDVMNGYELAGRVIKVGLVSDKATNNMDLNLDDSDTVGFFMNSYERANLMQKLSRNGEMQVPTMQPYMKVQNPTITTNVLLTNMFNPNEETEPGWENEIEEEVGGECSKFGKILNIVVANNTNGNVYIKYANITSAQQAVAALNGRYFGGKPISASFIIDAVFPQKNY